jgi:hypothetical protein
MNMWVFKPFVAEKEKAVTINMKDGRHYFLTKMS